MKNRIIIVSLLIFSIPSSVLTTPSVTASICVFMMVRGVLNSWATFDIRCLRTSSSFFSDPAMLLNDSESIPTSSVDRGFILTSKSPLAILSAAVLRSVIGLERYLLKREAINIRPTPTMRRDI